MTQTLGPLRTIAVEEGDVDMFPEPVLKLYDAGRRLAARTALLTSNERERDPKRKERQQHWADQLQLWADPIGSAPGLFTLNGFGTKVYTGGRSYGGASLGVLWLVALFIPVVPLSAYLVQGEGRGWRFFGKVPIPRTAWLAPTAWVGVAAAGFLFGVVPTVVYNRTHVDVAAYNGFSEPIVVSIGGDSRALDAREHEVFPGVSTGVVTMRATTPEGVELDSAEVDLSAHRGQTTVFNVASHDPLLLEWIRWGEGEALEGDLVPAGSVQFLDQADYLFVEPPETRQVVDGGHIDATWIHPLDLPPDPKIAYGFLVRIDLAERAGALVDAERRLHPTDGPLAWLAAAHRATFDPDSAPAFARQLRDALPDEVEAHRAYQAFAGGEPSALQAEYDALLAQHPDSAMLQYLSGRIREDAAGDAFYVAALERDPDYPLALRALGMRRSVTGDYAGAADLYQRYAKVGEPDPLMYKERVRLALVLGRDLAPLLAEEAERTVRLSDLFAAYRDPVQVEVVLHDVMARANDLAEDDARWIEAELRLVAGDLGPARELIRTEDGASTMGLRVALSDGATAEDRQHFLATLGRPEETRLPEGSGWLGILEWALVADTDPQHLDAWTEPLLAESGLQTLFPELWKQEAALRNPAVVEAKLAGRSLSEQASAYAALAFLLREDPAGSAYRRLARRFGLPSDLPWLRP